MIKGCERRMIKIENPESELFEAAYFIVRQNAPLPKKCKKDDMLREALRLTDSGVTSARARADARRSEILVRTAYYAAGVASAAVAVFAGYLL